MSATNYHKARRGTELTHAKVDEEAIRIIRRLHSRKERLVRALNKKYSAEGLGRRFGLSKSNVNKIVNYATWRHVSD
jgi:hypothetical protein